MGNLRKCFGYLKSPKDPSFALKLHHWDGRANQNQYRSICTGPTTTSWICMEERPASSTSHPKVYQKWCPNQSKNDSWTPLGQPRSPKGNRNCLQCPSLTILSHLWVPLWTPISIPFRALDRQSGARTSPKAKKRPKGGVQERVLQKSPVWKGPKL